MTPSDIVASCGVGLLLLAFALNLFGFLPSGSRAYQALNLVGAGLAAWAAWTLRFLPFVVLEGTWALAALVALVRGESTSP